MSNQSENSKNAVSGRLDFIGLDSSGLDRLRGMQKHIDKHLPIALDLFYKKIATVPQVAKFFSGKEQMNRAQGSQIGHWKKIASGNFDGEYVEAANRIGLRHAKIGLEPRWYIGGYGVIVETLIKGVVHDFMAEHVVPPKRGLFGKNDAGTETALAQADTLAASLAELMKAVMIDIDFAVTVYFDKMTADSAAEQEAIKERVGRELGATGDILRKLADGDLTARITADFDPSLQQIKDDTNAVLNNLSGIVTQLRDTSGMLKSATGEILAGTNDLAERTTKQAATVEETSAAVEQLANTVQENATRADSANSNTRAVAHTAEETGKVMVAANDAMERISASSSKISNIIGLIDDIAFQTNLLALNASVEAARAGDAGKGFAVVAVEVRRLAQSAANASSEVKALIEQSSTEVSGGSKLVAEASQKLENMLKAVRENSSLIEGIAQATKEQSNTISEVTTAVRQIDEMTQHNAALVEETNAAIEQTEGQANELDRIVDVFVVDGAPRRRAAPAAGASAGSGRAAQGKVAAASKTYLTNGNAAVKQEWSEF